MQGLNAESSSTASLNFLEFTSMYLVVITDYVSVPNIKVIIWM